MYYRWVKVPSCGEVHIGNLRIGTGWDTLTVHDSQGTYYPRDWMRVEDDTPEIDIWLFEQAPVRAVAVKTVYRSAWNYDRWVKLFP